MEISGQCYMVFFFFAVSPVSLTGNHTTNHTKVRTERMRISKILV